MSTSKMEKKMTLKEKFEKAAMMVWGRHYKDLDSQKKKDIRYMVCSDHYVQQEKQRREKQK